MSLPNLLPPLSAEEYDNLKTSMQEHGWWPQYPAVKDEDGNVLDGWHRLQAAEELKIKPVVTVITGLSDWEKIQFAVKGNTHRRQLNADQRRDLLRRLKEVYDEILRQAGKEAMAAGGATTPKVVSSETSLREAAANATKSEFNGPVTVTPREKKDRLAEYSRMLNVSRATVARDERAIERIEQIEQAAEEQGRDDVVAAVNAPRPNLKELEREVGLAPVAPSPPPAPAVSEDREGELDALAVGLLAIHYKPFTVEDARHVLRSTGIEVGPLVVDLMNVFRAFREVEKNG